MRRIMVINSKGGCGKTTIASNLAAYYASRGKQTVLFDYDPQGSSLQWVRSRSPERPAIHGVPAYRGARDGVTRTWQLRVPTGSERVVLDTPAGVGGQELADMVKRVDAIIVPVQPSPIDIHACSHFVRDLLLIGKVRTLNVRVAVVANRVRERTHGFNILERFLNSLKIPFVTSLRDTQNYVKAAEQGIGIHELDAPFVQRDRTQWEPLLRWIEDSPEVVATPQEGMRAPAMPAPSVPSDPMQARV